MENRFQILSDNISRQHGHRSWQLAERTNVNLPTKRDNSYQMPPSNFHVKCMACDAMLPIIYVEQNLYSASRAYSSTYWIVSNIYDCIRNPNTNPDSLYRFSLYCTVCTTSASHSTVLSHYSIVTEFHTCTVYCTMCTVLYIYGILYIFR